MRVVHLVSAIALLACGACGGISNDADVDAGGDDASAEAARLSGLVIEGYAIEPAFDPSVTNYTVVAPFYADDVLVTASAPAEHFITVADSAVDSGEPSDPISLALGANPVSIEVVSFGKQSLTYTLSIERGQNVLEYAKASNTGVGDQFGFAMAVSGDLLAIGAPVEASASIGINGDQNDNNAGSAGAVYVFTRESGAWVQEAYIKPAVVQIGDNFGLRLALDGDTLVVGSTSEDSIAVGVNGNANIDGAVSSGAAWVFVRSSAGTWSQQAYLKASNTQASDNFGDTVAVSGDTIAVSATGEDSASIGVGGVQASETALSSGAVYVFQRQAGVWAQQAYIKASNTQQSDLFGQSVAISGDTLVVGADGEDSASTGINGAQNNDNALSSGAAYVFVRNGALWTQEAYLKASNPAESDVFGRTVAIAGNTIAVSAEGEDSTATGIDGNQANNEGFSAGAIYVFVRTGGLWTQEAYVKASNTQPFDRFGVSIGLDGEGMVVGADFEDSAAAGIDGNQADNEFGNAGAAYVFRRTGTTWRQTNYLKAANPGTGDSFGNVVDISGNTVIAAARLEDSAATGTGGDGANETAVNAGAFYVFE